MSLAEKRSVQPVASLQLPRPNALERGQINGSPSLFNYPLPPSAASDASLISSPRRQSFVPSPSHRRPSPGSAHDEPSDEAKTMFQQRCVEFYYQGNALSGKAVDTTLRDAPPLQRKSFNTIQANVRGQFHIDTANRKRLNLHALLRDIQPGSAVANHCRLSPASPVQAWRSKDARAFRYRQLCEFVKLYARREHPGPQPFLKTLKVLLLLQALSHKEGGAGAFRIEWSIQDAVWMESGGEDFAKQGVELLKGVLGFEEVSKEEADSLSRQSSLVSSSSEVAEMSPLTRRGPPPVPPHRSTNPSSPSRPQAQQTPKNPFDPSPPLGSSPEPFFGSTSKQQDQQTHNHPAFPTSPLNAHRVVPQVATTALFNRIFVVAPYLTNPELSQLSYALPHWLRVSARFYSAPTSPEEQVELRVEGGHGTIKISLRPRDGGYGGTLLERVKAWFTALFG